MPNCFAAWSATLGAQTLHALSDVASGEELCVAYVRGINLSSVILCVDRMQWGALLSAWFGSSFCLDLT